MILIRIPTTDFDLNCHPTPKKYLGGIVWMVSVLISQYVFYRQKNERLGPML